MKVCNFLEFVAIVVHYGVIDPGPAREIFGYHVYTYAEVVRRQKKAWAAAADDMHAPDAYEHLLKLDADFRDVARKLHDGRDPAPTGNYDLRRNLAAEAEIVPTHHFDSDDNYQGTEDPVA